MDSSTTQAALLKQFWLDTFLNEYRQNLVFEGMAQKATHPRGEGKLVHWLALADLSAAGTLSEGFDPTSFSLSAGDLTANLIQYGATVTLTDVLKDTWINGSMQTLMERMARQAAVTMDTVVRDTIFTAGGLVQYAGTAVARNSIATTGFDSSVAEFREATATLEKAGAPRYGEYYAGVIHADVKYDIQGDSNWEDIVIHTPAGVDRAWKGEVGNVYGIRFIMSNQALKMVASGSAATDVYQSYIMGQEYFGLSELYAPDIIVKDPLPSSTLNLTSTVGWKAMFALKQLHQSGMVRLESGAALGS